MMEVNQSRHWTCRLLMEGENGAKRRMQRITASQSAPLPERNNLPARKALIVLLRGIIQKKGAVLK
ncbi:hypothetical protein [Paenibacillus sp. OSY-SE]|uniref:hypothetical protein n=1 Tax=Paenibacillus sp. OSY-SE TaxID=1196323 RepID=UPI0012FB9162|nr:hypothetical protein [Paenibacillus sp. OSY-SE]